MSYYKKVVNLNNMTLINHGDMNINWILNKWESNAMGKTKGL